MPFAGARFSLFINDGPEVSEIKGDKKGVGYRGIPYDQSFTNQMIDISPGQSFYLSTDGLIDQIGGERRRMFGKNQFKALIMSLRGKPFSEQKAQILKELSDYQGSENRRDDVSVIGFNIG